jgi:phosphate acetyltransferase
MHPVFETLMVTARNRGRLRTAVVHPCDRATFESVTDAVAAGLIEPTLVGPSAKIMSTAREVGFDLSAVELIDAPHSHAAAEVAVAYVRDGKAAALMKGALHTDELLGPVMAHATGLRTERRISHCYVMATRGHEDAPLIVTDAAINILPDLHGKADIVQNAIDLAHAIGITEVRVALLSAIETVNPAIPSTIDAAALCKMADRGQISGALIDGPLALDNAIDMDAVKQKHIISDVAGRANVLVVPNLEAGNILAKTLSFMAHAEAAGIVIGARVPIILTSRADTAEARVVSCALAVIMAGVGVLKGVNRG